MDVLKKDAEGFLEERVVKDKQGRKHVFMDRAIPYWDESGDLRWFEGIMVDITELKRLQEKALRTEEVRLLGEISARFAHEMRNPLATVGGFAHRLQDALSDNEQQKMFAKNYCGRGGPAGRYPEKHSIVHKAFFRSTWLPWISMKSFVLRKGRGRSDDRKNIQLETALSPSIPEIQGDGDFLKRAFGCILKNEIVNMPERERLFLGTGSEPENVVITIRHNAKGLASEDLTQFFFPRFTGKAETTIHDLPLARVVIHRQRWKGGRFSGWRRCGLEN